MDAAAAVRQFYAAMNTGDTSLFDDVLAEDWEEIPLNPGQGPGREGIKPVVGWLRNTLTGFTITEEDLIVSGDLVAVRSKSRGTHSGELMGLPGTGKEVAFDAFDWHRVQDGKIVQTWHVEDFLGVVHQVGGHVVPTS